MSTEIYDVGIAPIDRLLSGGIPGGTVLALSGKPGSGRGMISLRFLSRGFEVDQGCLFVSFTTIPLKALMREISDRSSMKALLSTEEPVFLNITDIGGLDLVQEVLKEGAVQRLVLDRAEVMAMRGASAWFNKIEEVLSKAREAKAGTIVIENTGPAQFSSYLSEGIMELSRAEGRRRAELIRWPFARPGAVMEKEEGEWTP